jgi:hypothetical protein
VNSERGNTLERPVTTAVVILGLLVLLLAAWLDRSWFEVHVFQQRCAVDDSDLHLVARVRGLTALAGVATLLVARPIGRRLGRDSGLRAWWVRIGAAVALALLVCGFVLRAPAHPSAPAPVPIALPPSHPDARLGWLYDAPRTTVLVDDERPIPYAVDADGDRAHSESDRTDPDQPTILFAGESVTFGLGVLWEEAYPTIVGLRFGVQVVNVGVHGYGDDQIRLHTLDRLAQLRRPVAVVTLAMADLVERDVFTWRDRLGVAADGSLFTVRAQSPSARESPLAALVGQLGHSDEALRTARAIFAATARDVRARGAYPLFVLTNYGLPCLPDASGRPSIEGHLFDGLDVAHIRVDLDPSAIVHTNGHPDARAHAQLAEAIASALVAAHVLPP